MSGRSLRTLLDQTPTPSCPSFRGHRWAMRAARFMWLVTLLAAASAEEVVVLHVVADRAATGDGTAQRPLGSLAQLPPKLRQIARSHPEARVEVWFGAGVHHIEQPLRIGLREVPAKGSLLLRPAGDEPSGQRAVICGGVLLGPWKVHGDGRWTTQLPESFRGRAVPRELFAGGVRRPRARHPNHDFLRIDTAFPDKRSGFTFPAGSLPRDYRGGGELLFLHDWSTSRVPVASVDHASRRLSVAFPIGNRAAHYRIDHFEPHPRFAVENHAALLDAPGEWFITAEGRVTYRPLPGETPQHTEVVVPLSLGLLQVVGESDRPVARVRVRGLHFVYAAWPLPPHGYAGSQATAYEARGETRPGRPFVPSAIAFEQASDCVMERCTVAHIGMSGVALGSRTRRCRISDCVIEDISGNGINLGEDSSRRVEGKPWWRSAPQQVAQGHRVEYNRIVRCGRQFYGAVAIWIGLARGMTVARNEIADQPYTGISVGWMWNLSPTPASENHVVHNHIHHVMLRLSDGGGIYTLGRQPGTRLAFNMIHDVPINAGRAESNGMFLDEGSDQIEIDHNTIYDVVRSPLRFHRARKLRVHDNTLVVADAKTPPFRYNATDPQTIERHNNRIVLRETFSPDDGEAPLAGPRP